MVSSGLADVMDRSGLIKVYVGKKKQNVTAIRAVLREVINSSLRGDRHAQKLPLGHPTRSATAADSSADRTQGSS